MMNSSSEDWSAFVPCNVCSACCNISWQHWKDPALRVQERAKVGRKRAGCDDLREPARSVTIVTTASLPWMTGTAINPLLRAFYLAEQGIPRQVTLVVPWLSMPDQKVVYPNQLTFETPEQQEQHVRQWVEKRTGKLSSSFKVSFYPGRYAPEKGSILPVGDVTQVRPSAALCFLICCRCTCHLCMSESVPHTNLAWLRLRVMVLTKWLPNFQMHVQWIPEHEADVAVLEEPEHLNWYQHGRRWTDKFNHVVGIMHTNYLDYARREEHGALKAAFLRAINSWVCRVHTHKVIKLSDAVQRLPRQCTQFVHGVSPKFLEVGALKSDAYAAAQARAQGAEQAAQALSAEGALEAPADPEAPQRAVWLRGAYFLGKLVWGKGYTELLELLEHHKQKSGLELPLDIYGHGDDKAVRACTLHNACASIAILA